MVLYLILVTFLVVFLAIFVVVTIAVVVSLSCIRPLILLFKYCLCVLISLSKSLKYGPEPTYVVQVLNKTQFIKIDKDTLSHRTAPHP